MTPPVSPYTSVISPRSRRYRTLMTVLLALILMMSVFGFFKVMPQVRQSVGRPDMPELTRIAASQPGPNLTSKQIAHAKQIIKKRKLVVYLAMAYWGICSLFLVSILLLFWLDFRETTRNFVIQAQSLRENTVATLQEDIRRQRMERGLEREAEDG